MNSDSSAIGFILVALGAGNERTTRELRHEIGESSRGARQEQGQNFARFQATWVQQGADFWRGLNAQTPDDAILTKSAVLAIAEANNGSTR